MFLEELVSIKLFQLYTVGLLSWNARRCGRVLTSRLSLGRAVASAAAAAYIQCMKKIGCRHRQSL